MPTADATDDRARIDRAEVPRATPDAFEEVIGRHDIAADLNRPAAAPMTEGEALSADALTSIVDAVGAERDALLTTLRAARAVAATPNLGSEQGSLKGLACAVVGSPHARRSRRRDGRP